MMVVDGVVTESAAVEYRMERRHGIVEVVELQDGFDSNRRADVCFRPGINNTIECKKRSLVEHEESFIALLQSIQLVL